MQVKIKVLRDGTKLPNYKHFGDAGVDLANMGESVEIPPFERILLPTGLAVAIPIGYELQIRPRSGMALNKGITLLNTPGTIDAGYRGEIGVIVYNATNEVVTIEKGERVAQAVLTKFEKISWDVVDILDETTRNDDGFGSTGTN